jgi:hypothetical protein|tara:strand:+ start:10134 stop:10310 length:177 start_codon:yes stop_codon:yes gene_type:complete
MKDCEIIEFYGGSKALCKLLGLEGQHSEIRVHQWKKRGIPAAIKLKYPEIFLKRKFKE